MITISIAYIVTVAALVVIIESQLRRDSDTRAKLDERMQEERQRWAVERGLLLERIQRPEFTPVSPVGEVEDAEPSFSDELHLVGSILDVTSPPPDDAA